MRVFNTLVFDEWIQGTASYYTSTTVERMLGESAQKLALQLIVDGLSTNTTITAELQQSADGQSWAVVGDIISQAITTGGVNNITASVDSVSLLARVRLRLHMASGAATAHTRLWVCGRRDRVGNEVVTGGGQPIGSMGGGHPPVSHRAMMKSRDSR